MPNRTRRRPFLLASAVVALGAIGIWRMPEVAAWSCYVRAGRPAMLEDEVSLAAPLRWFDNYYAVAEIGDGAYAIGEPRYGQCNFSYLIVGSERALLFDTGPGIRDITKVVKALTSLPTVALPSHLHFDHIGNLPRFEEVALPDLPALRAQTRDGRFSLGCTNSWDLSKGSSARPSGSPAGSRQAPISTSAAIPWS